MNTQANVISRTGLTRKRWQYLKTLRPSPARYLHVSAEVRMIPNPLDPQGLLKMPLVPWIQRPGKTFNAGRNKVKREKRAKAAQ